MSGGGVGHAEHGDYLKDTSVMKALVISTSQFLARNYVDMELLISRWSVETHTFVAASGEFVPTLQDVGVISRMLLLRDHSAMGLVLNEEEERTERLLNVAMRVLSKST